MPTLEFRNSVLECVITSNKEIGLINDHNIEMIRMLYDFNNAASIDSLTLDKKPQFYDYDVTLKDGRKWMQKIYITQNQEAEMTFTVNQAWKLSEFATQRPLRDHIIQMIRNYDVTNITCTWF